MAFQSAAIPTQDPIVSKAGIATQVMIDWATALQLDVDASPARLGAGVELTAQAASVGSTAIPIGSLASGYFRVTTFARITRAATTSSSLTVTLGGTDSGVTYTFSGAAITGNTTSTVQSFSVLLKNDQGASLTYQTAYVSVGATTMQYALSVICEQVQA